MQALSTGEKKALYVLNIIFEVEARRKAQQETLFIVDDIADSFDYRNKYAIIQYLMDIAEGPLFKQILLTHNFDFFRTVNSRFVAYGQCLMAAKTSNGRSIKTGRGHQESVREWRWKRGFFTDPKKRVASIPFLRNLIEYTRGIVDDDFGKLTARSALEGNCQGLFLSQIWMRSTTSCSTKQESPPGARRLSWK